MATSLENFLGLNRRIALMLAPFLARAPLTPNHITSMALLTGCAAAASFSTGSRAGLLVGAFLMQVYYILDNCDGAVARIRGLSSRLGMWYDFTADLVVDLAMWTGFGVAVYSRGGASYAAPVALAAALGSMIHFTRVVRGRLGGKTGKEASPDPTNIFSVLLHSLSNDGDPALLMWIFALIGRPEYFLVLGCIYIHYLWIAGVVTGLVYKTPDRAKKK